MNTIKRFYKFFQPNHYQLFFDIDRKQKTIQGHTIIQGLAQATTIFLHQKFLTIDELKINHSTTPFKIDDDQETLTLQLSEPGLVTIDIKYHTNLTDSMVGIYPSYYKINGLTKQIIGTQFESTFARQAFPCLDEPEAKAAFDLAIKFDEHPQEMILANMPENNFQNGFHYFTTTPKMSTYLIAFAFGELQSQTTRTNSGVEVGIFSTKAHDPKELNFPLQIAKRAIEFYEEFYQTPYPLPNSWHLALPDFSSGAMENWGLITYREAFLLLNPDNSTYDNKMLVATSVAHELAHQWFGNLVTMKWWDDIWLNESFANMMMYVAIDHLLPDSQVWELFQKSEVPDALDLDAIDGAQAIHQELHEPDDIEEAFSDIVYAKGARILVMIRALLGDTKLREGLKLYFAKHQYGNTAGNDLWQALGEASKLDLKNIMQSWINQPGYPVIQVSQRNQQLILTQKQFFIGEHANSKQLWEIPLNSNYPNAPKVMTEQRLIIDDYPKRRQKNSQPFYLNIGNDAHYIVQYDNDLLADILANLNSLDTASQYGLLQDLSHLASAQAISYAQLIPILPYFANNHSDLVNTAVYDICKQLKDFVEPDTVAEKQLQTYFDRLSFQQMNRLGLQIKPNEPLIDQASRPLILKASLTAKNHQTITAAHQILLAVHQNFQKLPADIRSLILSNELCNFNSNSLFTQLFNEYQSTADTGYKDDLLTALTATTNLQQLQKLISALKNSELIKPQDIFSWIKQLLNNTTAQQLTWDWLRDNWNWLEKNVGIDLEFSSFIEIPALIFHTPQRLAEYKTFFEPKLTEHGFKREIEMDTRVLSAKVALVSKETLPTITALTNFLEDTETK